MRPPAESQSALRYPFNKVLGTETNVRVLRVLATTAVPLGKTEVARQAHLNPVGVRRALKTLIELGIVEQVGKTARQPVRLRSEHPLSEALRDLFQSERGRFDILVGSLREIAAQVQPPLRSAWIQGPVARGCDEPGDPIVVGVLTSARNAASARTQLLTMLPDFVRDPDVQIVLQIWTTADMGVSVELEQELESAIMLVAPHPLYLLDGRREVGDVSGGRSHRQLDRQALALARAIAHRLPEDPELIPRAASYLRRRMERASDREKHDLSEWLHILEHKSASQVRRLLLEPGERATRLRQSLPFLEVLTDTERNDILRQASDDTR